MVRQVYDYQKIEPYPTYYALKRALQPILISAELWGRNLYGGEKLPTRIYVVNDREGWYRSEIHFIEMGDTG